MVSASRCQYVLKNYLNFPMVTGQGNRAQISDRVNTTNLGELLGALRGRRIFRGAFKALSSRPTRRSPYQQM